MFYAVNKQTKEHRIALALSVWDGDWQIVAADDDGWIEWCGGECPLPRGLRYDVKCRNGCELLCQRSSLWGHGGLPHDIIAYRPILDDKPQAPLNDKPWWSVYQPEPPEWNGEGLPPVGAVCEILTARNEWLTCTIVFQDGDIAIGRIHDGQGAHNKCDWSREGFRPLCTDREKWIEAAGDIAEPEHETAEEFLEAIYDALKSGDLPMPKTDNQ